MSSTLTRPTKAPAHASDPAAAPRLDLYAPIHKALRLAMSETLVLVGRLDVHDAAETIDTLARVDALLDLLQRHVEHENEFVHGAIEARCPNGAARTAEDHVEHLASIEALRDETRTLRSAGADARAPLALRLYRHLALFVAENFQHMHVEETANNTALWSLYTDAELMALHDRLLASIPPVEHLEVARWMVPALDPAERAGMLQGVRATVPPEAFLGVLGHVRPHVDARGWTKLARALGVAERPGQG
ncbi:MAG TPA: hypothetical protein VMU47_09135 [Caldimonas sp.]|nr:hypothetical protein [Caldimonas sp.]